jgi:Tol biopolymer transport system component
VFTHAGSYRLIYAVGFTAENGRERMANTKHFGALAAAAGALVAMGLVLLIMLVVEVGPAEAAFPGQNGKIAYSGSDGQYVEIYTIDPSGGEKFKVTNNTESDVNPAYSPDGKRIAYQSWDGGYDEEIITIGSCGRGKFNVTNNFTSDSAPSYSPNGQRIAYRGWEGHGWEIYTINTGGGSEVQLTDNTLHYENRPDYSPDGQNIAYDGAALPPDYGHEIYTIDPGGGEKFKVTNSTGPAYGPSYSPDGQKIAYAGRDALTPNADYEIYTINASGAGRSLLGLPLNKPVRLTNNTTHDRSPSWGKMVEVVKPCEALP